MKGAYTAIIGIGLWLFSCAYASSATPPGATGSGSDENVVAADLSELKSRLFDVSDQFIPHVSKQDEIESILGVKFSDPDKIDDQTDFSEMHAHGFRSLAFTASVFKDRSDPDSSVSRVTASFQDIPFGNDLNKCFSVHQARAELTSRGWKNVATYIRGASHGVEADKKGVYVQFSAEGGFGPIPEIDEIGGPPGSKAYQDFHRRMEDGCIGSILISQKL